MNYKRLITLIILTIFLISNCLNVFGFELQARNNNNNFKSKSIITKNIEIDISFSAPDIIPYGNYYVVRVTETNHNRIIMFDYDPGKPVLPVNISIFNLEFGSKIVDVEFESSTPEIINIPGELNFARASTDNGDNIKFSSKDFNVYESDDPYPGNWISYHTGGGLSYGERTTFLVFRVYPVRYLPSSNQIEFIRSINVTITYVEPEEPIIQPQFQRDLLILAPQSFIRFLKPLESFKENHGVKTELYSLEEVYTIMNNNLTGRDYQEKIKYFIKDAVEKWDVKYVLLVGGIRDQTDKWTLPVRYSHVVPLSEQEYAEQSFISDIYYADIFDGEGKFSSWDSNMDDIFAVWNETFREEMDVYPDVYLGRIPCRNLWELKAMVDKIIEYEKEPCDVGWFSNLLLVGGDSYIANESIWPEGVIVNEGELACEAAIDVMPGFNPLKVYATIDDINRQTVHEAFNQGAGFAYFCGHGNPMHWGTHFEPANNSNWVTGYEIQDMIFLKNREKQPITIVGGCHNGQFDVTMWNILLGIREEGLKYFSWKSGEAGQFWFSEWVPNCWAWWLTSKPKGGAIATIANTGLGTHGDGDQDYNGVVDYIEILDGWLELRFLELYGIENSDILGLNHGEALTEYLNRFLGDDAKMDVKMVQQWELFGDPSLKIGGYS
jgi:hypothetical protein